MNTPWLKKETPTYNRVIASATKNIGYPFHNASFSSMVFAAPEPKSVDPFRKLRGGSFYHPLGRDGRHFRTSSSAESDFQSRHHHPTDGIDGHRVLRVYTVSRMSTDFSVDIKRFTPDSRTRNQYSPSSAEAASKIGAMRKFVSEISLSLSNAVKAITINYFIFIQDDENLLMTEFCYF